MQFQWTRSAVVPPKTASGNGKPSEQHKCMMMVGTDLLQQLECDSLSPRQIVLRRIASLEGDGVGLASPVVKILTLAIDRVDDDDTQQTNDASTRTCWNWDAVRELKRILQLHLTLSSTDSDLAEELAREGSHVQLVRVLRMDLPTEEADDDDAVRYHDELVEIQDIAGEIASHGGRNHFPRPCSPFTGEELRHRLPLAFCFDSNCRRRRRGCGSAEGIAPCCSNVALLHQVTKRQSAQRDVGFVTWPSAVALSQWIVFNPAICEKSNQILEIGAGCGLVGIVAARLPSSGDDTSQVQQDDDRPELRTVTLTDFNPLVLRNLERNIALNGVSDGCRVVGLDFNGQAAVAPYSGWKDMNGTVHDPVDLILGADIICQPEDAHGAALLIRNALRPSGLAVVVCADATARFGVDHFLPACEELGLQVDATPIDDMSAGDVSTNIAKTSGYVDGMKLNLYQITRR